MDKATMKINFANNLEDLLFKHGKKLTDVESVTKIDIRSLSAYRKQRALPSPERLAVIARYFGVTADYMVNEHKTESEKKSELEIIYNKLNESDRQTLLLMARTLLQKQEYDKKDSSETA